MSTFGKQINVSIFGESHNHTMGLTIHNLPSGIYIDQEKIKDKLILRKGLKEVSTPRNESDKIEIISGYFDNHTTGAPLTVLIYNEDTRSSDYEKIKNNPRPSHADYPAFIKYHGFNDYRGGGHFSGRITSLIVILGSICEDVLAKLNIKVISRVKSVGLITDDTIFTYDEDLMNDIFPVISHDVKSVMLDEIKKCQANNDSCGGVVETNVYNVPCGVGSPFFDSCESIISHLVFSIPGVKGIEFGGGFEMCKSSGSKVNDQMYFEDGVKFKSNYSGGINGGITNGNVINFKTAIKPTPSIFREQDTINLENKQNEKLLITGRHDPVIAIKALHVITAITYYAILELLLESRYEIR